MNRLIAVVVLMMMAGGAWACQWCHGDGEMGDVMGAEHPDIQEMAGWKDNCTPITILNGGCSREMELKPVGEALANQACHRDNGWWDCTHYGSGHR